MTQTTKPRRAGLTVLAAALVLASPAAAADGNLDSSFSGDGKALFDVLDGELDETAYFVRALPDGAIVVAGRVDGAPALLKVRANGTLETAFGADGWVLDIFGAPVDLMGMMVTQGGEILVLSSDNDYRPGEIARFLPNGTPDPGFGVDGIVELDDAPVTGNQNFVAQGAALDSQGRLLVAGYCRGTDCPGHPALVTRREADGDPDLAFGSSGWATSTLYLENNVVACGGGWACIGNPLETDGSGSLFYASRRSLRLLYLDAFGDPDPTFADDGLTHLSSTYQGIEALEHDPVSGKLYVALSNGNLADGTAVAAIARLLPDGEIDESYRFAGLVPLTREEGAWILDLALQSDGKLVGVGMLNPDGTQEAGFFLVRLHPNGTYDTSFDGDGWARYEFDLTSNGKDIASAVAISGGKAVVVGVAENAGSNQGGAIAILRAQSALIFSDGFERGSTAAW